MENPKVSIIIPCYGVERYLDRCMETIVRQTLKDIEIILVDDKSPDRVPQMCDEWAKRDARIKVIHKEKNEGLGFARNTGLDVATGEYVAFIDSDDYVDTSMFATLYEKAKETSSDIVYCGLKQEKAKDVFVDIQDFKVETSFEKNKLQELSIRYIDPPSGHRLFMSVWHSIYKRSVIGNLRFHSERVVCSEDLPFQVAMLLKSCKVTYIPNTYYYYCMNGNSLSKTFNFEKCFRYFTLAEIIKTYYPPQLEYHVWRFFFAFCQNFIRNLICSNLTFSEKYEWLKNLCNNRKIVNYLRIHKKQLGQKPHSHLYAQYYCFLIHKCILPLYLIALIDQRIICEKLGLKR